VNFFDVPEVSISDEQRDNILLDVVSGHLDETYEEPFGVYYKQDYFQFIYEKFCIAPTAVYILKLRAGWDCPPHVDDEYDMPRYSSMIIPLSPVGETYMPLRYLDRDNKPIETIHYRNHGFITDTTKLHHVVNNHKDRYNIQISFEQRLDELYKLYKEDKLLRNQ
jgi:hypothetical protein